MQTQSDLLSLISHLFSHLSLQLKRLKNERRFGAAEPHAMRLYQMLSDNSRIGREKKKPTKTRPECLRPPPPPPPQPRSASPPLLRRLQRRRRRSPPPSRSPPPLRQRRVPSAMIPAANHGRGGRPGGSGIRQGARAALPAMWFDRAPNEAKFSLTEPGHHDRSSLVAGGVRPRTAAPRRQACRRHPPLHLLPRG